MAPPKGEAPLLNGIKERVMATTRGAEEPLVGLWTSWSGLDMLLKVFDASDTAAAVLADKPDRTNESITAWRATPKKSRPNLKATSTHHAPTETK